MATVILFGGGDGGGLVIGPNGVRPIPPIDPAVLGQAQGLSRLVQAAAAAPGDDSRRELGQLVNKVANLLVPQVESIVGPLDGDQSLVYLDDVDGFVCGSTGRPPIPLPWPPRRVPALRDLVADGAIDGVLLDFLRMASERNIGAADILTRPRELAREFGYEIEEHSLRDLEALSPHRLDRISDPAEREAVAFFHKVVDDGRFLETWATKPAEVAERLGMSLSDAAANRLITAGASAYVDPGSVMNPVAIAVVVGVVIMLVDREAVPSRLSVIDRSGRAKF